MFPFLIARDQFLQKEDYYFESIRFQLDLFANNSLNFEVANKRKSFLIFSFAKVTVLNLSTFWPVFILNDITRRFCDLITLIWAFSNLVAKQLISNIWTAYDVIEKWWRRCDDVINSKPIFL